MYVDNTVSELSEKAEPNFVKFHLLVLNYS